MKSEKTQTWLAVGVLSTSVLIGLLLIELVFAPWYVFRDVDRSLGLMGFYAPPGMLVDDTLINSDGFTGHALADVSRENGGLRVLTLGGSTMFNRRMTERMIASWTDALPTPPQVVGAALRTHTTRASVIKYDYLFSKYQFDYVLIYHGINDLWANNVPPEIFRPDYSHQNAWGRRGLLLDHSVIARRVYNSRQTRRGTFPTKSNQADFMADKSFEANLRALVASVRSNGGIPVLMTFASFIPDDYSQEKFSSGELPYNNPTRYDYCPVELWGDVAYVKKGLQRLNAIVRRLASELDVDLIEQAERLSAVSLNFGDSVHFSELGTDRFIANITDYLLEDLGAPANPSGGGTMVN